MSRRIIVTGAAGILGSSVVGLLQKRGFATVGLDLAASGSGEGEFVGGMDLTDENAVADAVAAIAAKGPIGGLANIAGGFVWETVLDGSAASWMNMFRINVLTTLNASRAVIPHLAPGGAIVNIGAAATSKAGAGMGAYTASKSGVARLTEALAEECKDKGIRVNAVLPSIIDTPANRADMGDADAAKWVNPSELAETIAFLLSDAASAITGASLPVTGRV